MRVLLLRPPRCLWPFNSEYSSFWPPLGLLCIAAAVRRDLPGVEVEVWDAPGRRWGWRTLTARLRAARFDVLGIGEETASAHEALRAAAVAKQSHPDCIVVAGGTHFPHCIPQTLADPHVDVIVRGEGEVTFTALLQQIEDRAAWSDIPGLAFRNSSGGITVTPARPLIADLDSLPRPAWDLVDLPSYGQGSRNHPALVSVEHSRGCVDSCGFCILWRHMGESLNGNGRVRPRYRTKSPERSFDEVEYLHRRYGRRTFGWVDPTFNGSPEWSDGWAERMLRSPLVGPRGPRTLHTAWLRVDGVLRDEKLGIMDKLVRAGLRQAVIGLERDDAAGLALLGKHRNDAEMCRAALAVLREKYPQVYVIGSIIVGLPGDTAEDLNRLVRWQDELDTDYCFFIPLTPTPGTTLAAEAASAGRIARQDLAAYNFHAGICTTGGLDVAGVESVYWRAMLRTSPRRFVRLARNLLLERDARKRRVNWALFRHGTGVALESLWHKLVPHSGAGQHSYGRRPSWYES